MFDPVRDRIRKSAGKIRKLGVDHLCYALIDAVVDDYFVVLDKISVRVELLEEELFPSPRRESVQHIHELRRDMIFLRRAIWPLREVAASLQRTESELIRESAQIYLRDVHDHVVQVTDSIDTFRDMLSSMLDMYHSSIGNRTNEIIKVLTLSISIFMPLSFITGIVGMNFKDFPLLEWHWGFAGVMVFMVAIWVAMMLYFRRRHWL
jgi:magnesium transporter